MSTVINIDPNEPPPAPAGPRLYRLWQVILYVLLTAVLCIGLAAVVTGRFSRSEGHQPGYSTYKPKSVEEKALFAKLRPASLDEILALTHASDEPEARHGLYTKQLYVATGDLTLPAQPLGQEVLIGLPKGKHWVGGAFHNITLVLADVHAKDPVLGLRDGRAAYDPYCFPRNEFFVTAAACTDQGQQPATHGQMYRSLKKLPDKTLASGLNKAVNEAPFGIGTYYYASGNIRLEPFLGPADQAPVLILGSKALITGGQLGRLQVVSEADILAVSGSYPPHGWFRDPVYADAQYDVSDSFCGYLGAGARQLYPTACK